MSISTESTDKDSSESSNQLYKYYKEDGLVQTVDKDGNPILKRSESPTGGSGGTIEKKKKNERDRKSRRRSSQ